MAARSDSQREHSGMCRRASFGDPRAISSPAWRSDEREARGAREAREARETREAASRACGSERCRSFCSRSISSSSRSGARSSVRRRRTPRAAARSPPRARAQGMARSSSRRATRDSSCGRGSAAIAAIAARARRRSTSSFRALYRASRTQTCPTRSTATRPRVRFGRFRPSSTAPEDLRRLAERARSRA